MPMGALRIHTHYKGRVNLLIVCITLAVCVCWKCILYVCQLSLVCIYTQWKAGNTINTTKGHLKQCHFIYAVHFERRRLYTHNGVVKTVYKRHSIYIPLYYCVAITVACILKGDKRLEGYKQ